MDYKVGQEMYCVPHSVKDGEHYSKIIKAGRKWFHLENGWKVDAWDGNDFGRCYSLHGSCYLSQDAYAEYIALFIDWHKFKIDLSWYEPPKGLTTEDIAECRRILGI